MQYIVVILQKKVYRLFCTQIKLQKFGNFSQFFDPVSFIIFVIMDVISECNNPIGASLDSVQSHDKNILEKNNCQVQPSNTPKRKRKYAPRKNKNDLVGKTKKLKKSREVSKAFSSFDTGNALNANNKNIDKLKTEPNNVLNPFTFSIILHVLQQRRNELINSLNVSSSN